MTREGAAAATAVNSGILIFFAVVLFALLNDSGPGALPDLPPMVAAELEEDPDEERDPLVRMGWGVYNQERCSACHSIAGQGSPRYPLDGVGDRLGPDELRLWVVAPQEIQPGVRKRPYDHLSDDDLEALVHFLGLLSEP